MRQTFSSVLVTGLAVIGTWAGATPGDPDPAFGIGTGRTGFQHENFFDHADALALQRDGKIVVAGTVGEDHVLIIRFLTDGLRDLDFGNEGLVSVPGVFTAGVGFQADGRIVLAVRRPEEFVLVRLLPDGTLDNDFGDAGVRAVGLLNSQGFIYCLEMQPDGRILLGGQRNGDAVVLRFHADGTPDADFGEAGAASQPLANPERIYDVSVQEDGRILTTGHTNFDVTLRRWNGNGTPDGDFGQGGMVVTVLGGQVHRGMVVAPQPDGRILVTVRGGTDLPANFILLRYLEDGSPDPSFGAAGRVFTDVHATDRAWALCLQSDGKMLVAGTTNMDQGLAVVRYRSDGLLDTSFGSGGKVETPDIPLGLDGIYLAVQPDGKVLLAASVLRPARDGYDITVLRFLGGPAVPVDEWRMERFGPDAQNAQVAADIADPDRDGMTNLLEYGLGGDPLHGDPWMQPSVSPEGGFLRLVFQRDTNHSDIWYHVQGRSGGLSDGWSDLATSVSGGPLSPVRPGVSVTETGKDALRTVEVRDGSFAPESTPQRFLRVKVVRP